MRLKHHIHSMILHAGCESFLLACCSGYSVSEVLYDLSSWVLSALLRKKKIKKKEEIWKEESLRTVEL